jgi:hypothetical protein
MAMTLPCLSARKVRAIFIQPPGNAPDKAILFTGKKSLEVALPTRNLSPEVSLPKGDLVITILGKIPTDKDKIPKAAQRVKIPKDWQRCILLFFPNPKNKLFPAKVIAVNASRTNFPKGDTLIYNVSTATLIAEFGKQRVRVKPKKTGLVKAPMKKFGSYPVAIDCILNGEKKRSTICRTNWQHDPQARQILFVVPAPGYKVPRVWGILDRASKPAKAGE